MPTELYLLRHAIAVPRGTPGYPGDDRPLTDDGITKMEKAARGIVAIVAKPDLIVTSPLLRARDTALIVARAFDDEAIVRVSQHLLPGGKADALWSSLELRRSPVALMLVGHEPDLGGLASLLIGASPGSIVLKKGGLCCIEVDRFPPRGPGSLQWLLAPKHLRQLADA